MGDTTVAASGGTGTLTVIHSSGRPFVEGAAAAFQLAAFSKKTPSGLEVEADVLANFTADDTLLLVFERRADDLGPLDEGQLHLAGGSGRFAGLNGHCGYRMDNRPGQWNAIVSNCQWLYSFPYR